MTAKSSRTELGCCCRSSTKPEAWGSPRRAVPVTWIVFKVKTGAISARLLQQYCVLHLAGFFLGRIDALLLLGTAHRFALLQCGAEFLIAATGPCPGLAGAAVARARWA